MPSEDNKQKVHLGTAVFQIVLAHAPLLNAAVPPSGWRRAALQPCDWAGDQTSHDGQESQLRQHQPGQVRPPPLSASPWHATPAVLILLSCLCSCSIRFAVARAKEGIIDFVRGSELKVAKGKRGHLLVVSHHMCLMSCVQPAGREGLFFFKYSKHCSQLTVFNLFPLYRLLLGSTAHEETENSNQAHSNPFELSWRTASQKLLV